MAEEKTSKPAPKNAPTARELRLKAALKANLGRRKTQARARNALADKTQAKDDT